MNRSVDPISFHLYTDELPPVLLDLKYAGCVVDDLVGSANGSHMEAIHSSCRSGTLPALANFCEHWMRTVVLVQDASKPGIKSYRIRIWLELADSILEDNLA